MAISDCERVSRELDCLLDVEDFITHPYVLEVSSPGLTRPLKKREDFERYKGRLCRIVTKTPIDGKGEFRGEIIDIAEDGIQVNAEHGAYTIPLDAIKKANLEFEI